MSISTVDNSLISREQWVSNRINSLGASEVATVVFGSRYSSNLEIWYSKVTGVNKSRENVRMLIGTETESLSAKFWEHYSGSEQSVVDNMRSGKPVKKCTNTNLTYFNSDFPHLSATPDRLIEPVLFYEGRKSRGCLEIKNTMDVVLKSYNGSLPVENVIQLITQLMCTSLDYGELFYFISNARFENHVIEAKTTKKVQDVILQHTKPFWDSVLLARPLYNRQFDARMNHNFRLVNELEHEIQKLEPPVQLTDGYLSFLTEKYKDRLSGAGVLQGKQEQFLIAKKHKDISNKISKLEKEQQKLEMELKLILKESHVLDFGKQGKVSWAPNKNNSRIFKNQIQ